MLTLYQFPISHYCEKARWALDYKKLDYRAVNLLPGLHRTKAMKLSGSSSLPILVHDGKAIRNSSDIIDYLDQHLVSRLRELPPQPLAERYVNLSIHTAPIRQTLLSFPPANGRTSSNIVQLCSQETAPLWFCADEGT